MIVRQEAKKEILRMIFSVQKVKTEILRATQEGGRYEAR